MSIETLRHDNQTVYILDQTRLPHAWEYIPVTSLDGMAIAIRDMQVRGAPLIGASAAFGLALAMQTDASDTSLEQASLTLLATRPTAVNLHWALARMQQALSPLAPAARKSTAWIEAEKIRNEDASACKAIGAHGLTVLHTLASRTGSGIDRPLQGMTHCNAGALATCGMGTALAPIYTAHHAGLAQHIWVSETRPRNQGYLTAAELGVHGVPHTLIADNAAGLLLQQERVDYVIVGADRIAANGDTANKIGTYLKALAAKEAGIPFYIAAPWSTVDMKCASGTDIPIEARAAEELRLSTGKLADGSFCTVNCVADSEPVWNPAFDITPASLITGIITERGIFTPALLRAAG